MVELRLDSQATCLPSLCPFLCLPGPVKEQQGPGTQGSVGQRSRCSPEHCRLPASPWTQVPHLRPQGKGTSSLMTLSVAGAQLIWTMTTTSWPRRETQNLTNSQRKSLSPLSVGSYSLRTTERGGGTSPGWRNHSGRSSALTPERTLLRGSAFLCVRGVARSPSTVTE